MVMIQPKGEVGIKTPWLDLFFSGSVRLNQVGAKQIRGRKEDKVVGKFRIHQKWMVRGLR